MFRNTAAAAVAADDVVTVCEAALESIPLSHLALDLPEPGLGGWHAYLAGHGIEVVVDDIGRQAIARADARRLFRERQEAEARGREAAARYDAETEARRVASIRLGIPAHLLREGVLPVTALVQALHDERPHRQSVLQHALENSGEFTIHPIHIDPDDES